MAARDGAGKRVCPGCWLACANRPAARPHMVEAVNGRFVRFADREPLHVGFLPWWRVVDGPEGGNKGKGRQ